MRSQRAGPDCLGGQDPEEVEAGRLLSGEELQLVTVAIGGVKDLETPICLEQAEGALHLFSDRV